MHITSLLFDKLNPFICSGCEHPARGLGVPVQVIGTAPVTDSDAFLAHLGKGTGMRFRCPIPVGPRGWKTRQLPGTIRILILNWAGTTCSPKSSGSCSVLLAMLRLRDPVHEYN